MAFADPQPIDSLFVEMVSKYLDRIQDRISTKPEPRIQRPLRARRPRIGNTEAHIVRSALSAYEVDQSELPAWVKHSVVVWSRELRQSEVLRHSSLALQEASPRPVCLSGDRDAHLTHHLVGVGNRFHTKSP